MKLTITGIVMLFITQLSAQITINKPDFNWEMGNQWNNLGFNVNPGDIDVTPGASKTWDFTFTAGSYPDTTKVLANDGAVVTVHSTTKGDLTYQIQDSTYTLKFLSGVAADDPNVVSVGLPHYYGKSWSYVGTGLGGLISATVSGEVIAHGSVVLQGGTYDCLLIKEDFIGPISQTNYYWETKEHGQVAVYYYTDGEIYIFQNDTVVVTTYPDLGPTITKEDLKWHQGRQENVMKYSTPLNLLQVEGGDSIQWDFTNLSGGTPDTARVYFNNGDTVKLGSQTMQEQWFTVTDSSYAYKKIENYVFDEPNNTTIGMPHKYGKSWVSQGTLEGGTLFVTIQGLVSSEGKITLPLGTFDCVLVKEVVSGALPGINYYWETKEHGRVAARFSAYDALFVLQDTVQTAEASSVREGIKSPQIAVFPNPSNDGIYHLTEVSNYAVYDTKGVAIRREKGNQINLSNEAKGTYILEIDRKRVRLIKQ